METTNNSNQNFQRYKIPVLNLVEVMSFQQSCEVSFSSSFG